MNNANMKELQEGQAIIDDVDTDGFVYKRDYSWRGKEQEQQPEIGSNDAAPSDGEDILDEKAVEPEEPLIEAVEHYWIHLITYNS
jgi:hypothetical protein